MTTIIPIHHTETEVIPMNNCGSGQVFARIDGGKAWKCMSEVDYSIMREQQREDGRVAGLWISGIIVGAIFITIIWAWRDSNH